ncbi:unnamed protein product, partial [Tilletia caries]
LVEQLIQPHLDAAGAAAELLESLTISIKGRDPRPGELQQVLLKEGRLRSRDQIAQQLLFRCPVQDCRGSSGYLKSLARHCAVQHPQPLPSIEADPSALQISGQPVHTIAPASSATIAFAHESVYVADAVRFGAVTWTRTNLSLIAALATFALLLNFVFCLVNAAIQSSA